MNKILQSVVFVALMFLSSYAAKSEDNGKITVLYDAFGTSGTMLKDWGFSAFIEYGGKRILFDTGNNADIFAHNVKAKGIDFTELDFGWSCAGSCPTRFKTALSLMAGLTNLPLLYFVLLIERCHLAAFEGHKTNYGGFSSGPKTCKIKGYRGQSVARTCLIGACAALGYRHYWYKWCAMMCRTASCSLLLQLWRARETLEPAVLNELGKQCEQPPKLFFLHE